MRCFAIACILFVPALWTPVHAEVYDRIAVAVGNRAIKESQINSELRVTDFLNNAPLDLSAAAKRKAADHLIDQTLIRGEMARGSYGAPSDAEVNDVLARVKKTKFHSDADYQKALSRYGLSESELRSHLAWQLQVLRFIDARFAPAVRMRAAKNTRPDILEERVNTEFFAWLDEARARAHIQFHEEAFQ